MGNKYSMIITTCANAGEAKSIAKVLVEKQLAACVQMFPIESVNIWRDNLCEDSG